MYFCCRFDELQYIRFVGYYMNRTFFFDTNPPLGTMLIACVGWFVDFDEEFAADHIGQSLLTFCNSELHILNISCSSVNIHVTKFNCSYVVDRITDTVSAKLMLVLSVISWSDFVQISKFLFIHIRLVAIAMM